MLQSSNPTKKWIRKSSTTISTVSLNNNYFKIFTSVLLNSSLKTNKIPKELLGHGKHENKRESMAIVNQITYHSYIL